MRVRHALKELLTWILSSLISLVVLLAIVEVGYHLLKPTIYTNDRQLGWNLRANAHATFVQRDLNGHEYPVDFRTDANAVRPYGTNSDARHRILVLGDSFTGEPSASNDAMWFASMVRQLARETGEPEDAYYVWAGGAGGWGTYQNLLFARKLATKLRPTLFILQFCTNDYSNNHFEWETQGIARNQTMRRPYADPSNLSVPRYYGGLIGEAYRSVLGESKVFNSLDALIQRIEFKRYGGYGKPIDPVTEIRFHEEAINLTRTLLGELRKQFPGIPAAIVSCDGEKSGLSGRWVELARETGFIPLEAPSAFLKAAKDEGKRQYFGQDGTHLSEEGNVAFGNIVAEALASHGIRP